MHHSYVDSSFEKICFTDLPFDFRVGKNVSTKKTVIDPITNKHALLLNQRCLFYHRISMFLFQE